MGLQNNTQLKALRSIFKNIVKNVSAKVGFTTCFKKNLNS